MTVKLPEGGPDMYPRGVALFLGSRSRGRPVWELGNRVRVERRKRRSKESDMGDIENKAEELKGAAKETFGDATDNEDLQAEGAADQAKADVKQAGENVKDAVKDTFDR